jgi:hypothetical protein
LKKLKSQLTGKIKSFTQNGIPNLGKSNTKRHRQRRFSRGVYDVLFSFSTESVIEKIKRKKSAVHAQRESDLQKLKEQSRIKEMHNNLKVNGPYKLLYNLT